MKSKTMLVLCISALFVLVLGLSFLAIRLLESNDNILALLVIIGIVSLVIISFNVFKRLFGDIKEGFTIQDERTKKIKIYAAGYSYFASIYIWLALLVFQKYLDRDDIIITGLFGMAISFLISSAILSKRKDFE
ncbi:MAG: hypothetical protein VR67_00615 [Peptococcaceae bacterium BRH_c8a]|nr:MAG: hypothetical protein VR67_00615 [Peptococcaceae bacterium BRH_c8a]